ncbi:replicative DNA helicase [Planctomyces sp. SH-PL14]|uniref:replicative DNA helicase n=1 Tax=Planctomyces sp. SH-PL14 TaxID=1632864 RepID=UPI00078D4FDF|nr:replicative DNA helicase [Planctomyces sp. SH-PL14]AMV17357.1 Replicative DNA helicase [Planctomyces sp. SH-PL14]
MPAASSPAELFDKVPPQDLEAERCVLGSVLIHNQAMDDVVGHVQKDHFYADAHRKMFDAIHAMYEGGIRGIDAVTLRDELDRRGDIDAVGGVPYILKVLETVPHAAHAEYYAKIVRNKALQRSLIDVCTDSLREAYHGHDDIEDILARAEKNIFEIVENQTGISKNAIADILEETFARIFERMDKEGAISGIPTGFNSLDDMLSGFQPSELIVLAARPAMGKTALVCNFALAISKYAHGVWENDQAAGKPTRNAPGGGVLLFSLEQSKLELAERLLCIHAKLNGHKLRQGTLDEMEQYALTEGSNELRHFPIFIDDQAGQTMTRIAAVSRRLKRSNDIGIVIIDYLQLIEAEDKNLPREQQISSITRRLKFLAKELHIPVIALGQLNRGVEQREDKRPRLADLRESGAIEQDADIVMFLHRPDAYEPDDRPGEADLIVAKNRHGPIGTAELVWLKHALKFGDKSPISEPEGF